MTQLMNQSAYNQGYIMFEPMRYTTAFKFLGMHFSSNKRRNHKYSFKTTTWRIDMRHNGVRWDKIAMILTGKVHLLRGYDR